eukprot:454322-Prymnesium_polylepis.1
MQRIGTHSTDTRTHGPPPWARARTAQLHGLNTTIEMFGEKMPMMFKADGPLTTRTHKSGGGISYEHEITNLNKYRQIRMERMDSNADGSIVRHHAATQPRSRRAQPRSRALVSSAALRARRVR